MRAQAFRSAGDRTALKFPNRFVVTAVGQVFTIDWSRVTDPAIKARVSFPRVAGVQLEQTVARLIAAATTTDRPAAP